ncbi:MAG: nicotinate-nucleotide--dimethylbenzimidazole phosphoribosyltransferase [Halanaeroarchaeum sp.]
MKLVVVVGTTATGTIDGISAAGASPAMTKQTPVADAEILTYGAPVFAPGVPVSPTGCPSPSLVTRAGLDLLNIDVTIVDAGLAARSAAPAVRVDVEPGGDVRFAEPVPDASVAFHEGSRVAAAMQDESVMIAESIPGGTTSAMGVLEALGEPNSVSSSLPENPLERKREVVEGGLEASGVGPGDLEGNPVEAVRRIGDPVLGTVAGLIEGFADRGASVTLAGGSQMIAAAALARHDGVDAPLSVATTSFVEADSSFDLETATSRLDLTAVTTDPHFDDLDHVAFERFVRGEAKEGVGMGGILDRVASSSVGFDRLHDRIRWYYDRLVGEDGP